ncbi:TetR family transcriptional regulator C-terminal domain-containing protein [Fulvimarina sp. 2208YS6-2-32]|uniref:TetR family transcriptional regulator C-terminal domain-containing protein n=1 Tax=Fulvimarina uroteuthidis TaxID=3098149 RepID=A0ABU5I3M9_9HYPH|nr:TetR family transcriptional regulator C-terminal domain-containing protein [Fulvimarina sp. 2208YS6-2-32]MDY8109811.1 TetR family transcriptional regulator C-terminal domain-containing protein [Fulvimarina sp. 2208YS6-2-32]
MDLPNVSAADEVPTRIQARNREAILSAGREVFARHGLRGATLDEIARTAGMSKPNLLYYFRRKTDLYKAVLEEVLADWLSPLHALDPEGDPVEELRRYIVAKMQLSNMHPQASRLFAGEIIAGAPNIHGFLSTELRDIVARKARTIEAWVAQGRLAPIDPHHLIFAIWAITQHYADFDAQIRAVLGDRAGRPGFREEAAEAVLGLVLNGVTPR